MKTKLVNFCMKTNVFDPYGNEMISFTLNHEESKSVGGMLDVELTITGADGTSTMVHMRPDVARQLAKLILESV